MAEHSEEIDALEVEWRLWLRRVASYVPSRPHDVARARRFALVNVFGDMEQYRHDPDFHAKVHTVEQMLDLIDRATQSDSPEEADHGWAV